MLHARQKIQEIIPKYSNVEIKDFVSEGQFMDAYVELHKHTIQLLYIIVGLKYCDEDGNSKIVDKDAAIIGGNLTRLIKLNLSFLQNTCDHKLEICYIINRCLAETAINIKYMLVAEEERVKRNYIKHSLVTEKELWEIIISNASNRGNETLSIEQRMQQSIEASFENSDFEIEEISRSSRWKSVKSRAEVVANPMFYSVFYGLASHSIHGNWQDILFNNLKKVEGGFKLNLEWNHPRPQIIDAPILLNLEVINIFLEKELSNHENNIILKEKCGLLSEYLMTLIENHETWMRNNKKGQPAI